MSTGKHMSETTYQSKASEPRTNGYLLIDSRPCKITELALASGAITFAGRDVFIATERRQCEIANVLVRSIVSR